MIYEAIDAPNYAYAAERRKLEEHYFHRTTIEEFADMLWFDLGWSVNMNELKENVSLQKLFAK